MDLVLGVDGGNAKTIALVAGTDGTILGAARTGPSDIYGGRAGRPDGPLAELTGAIAASLEVAGASAPQVVSAVLSLAGADYPEDMELLRTRLRPLLPSARRFAVVNDALGALRGGTDDGVGVSVVVGSGDAVGARGRNAQVWHTSFWARAEGGAFEFGRRAFEAIVQAEIGCAPATSMVGPALERLEVASVAEMLHAFTRREDRREQRTLTRLAPVLLDAADRGDEVAAGIVSERAARLACYARTAAARVGLTEPGFPIVLAGGVFRHPSSIFADRISARVPEATASRARFEPAVGALLLALDAMGAIADAGRLVASLPGSELFTTSV